MLVIHLLTAKNPCNAYVKQNAKKGTYIKHAFQCYQKFVRDCFSDTQLAIKYDIMKSYVTKVQNRIGSKPKYLGGI